MRDPDPDRVQHELARLVDRTDRLVETPDVAHIHRRAESRTIRGIAATFAVTTVVGVALAGAVVGVGGVGMHEGQPTARAGHRAGSAAPTGADAPPADTGPPLGAAPQGTVAAPTLRSQPTPVRPVPPPHAGPTTRPTPAPTVVLSPTEPARSPPPTRAPAPVRTMAPSRVAPTPSPVAPAPQTGTSATTITRPPLVLSVSFRSGQLDAQGCPTARRVDRTVPAPTPRSVVRAVLAGPTVKERGRGVRSVFGQDGQPTPATLTVDWARHVMTVDFSSTSAVGISPSSCRGREIRGPVVDALRQYDPRWSVRFSVSGRPAGFTDYVDGA